MPLSKQEEFLRKAFIGFGQKTFGTGRGWMTKYANALGIQLSQVSSYAKGRIAVGAELREKMRKVGWVSASEEVKTNVGIAEIELQRIPVFEYARAGSKSMVLAEKPSYHIASTKSKDDSRFAVVVKGNSMEPEIKDGELVVVSKKRDPKKGDLCLIMFEDGDCCLRRVYFQDHTVTLTSANEREYPPTVHKKSEIRFIYRMVQKITNY